MKRVLLIAVLIAGVGVSQANAQFLRELKDRAIERSKDVVIGKTAEKAADKTGEAMDKILNPDFGKFMNPEVKKLICQHYLTLTTSIIAMP